MTDVMNHDVGQSRRYQKIPRLDYSTLLNWLTGQLNTTSTGQLGSAQGLLAKGFTPQVYIAS